jgi:hypothetical protein
VVMGEPVGGVTAAAGAVGSNIEAAAVPGPAYRAQARREVPPPSHTSHLYVGPGLQEPTPARVSLHVTKLAGVRGHEEGYRCFCSSLQPTFPLCPTLQQLPMESDHGEHLLSERLLVMGHCPRAHQRSRDIIGHDWSAQGPLNSPVGRAAVLATASGRIAGWS